VGEAIEQSGGHFGVRCPAGEWHIHREGPKTDVHSLKLRLVVIIARQAMRSNAERG